MLRTGECEGGHAETPTSTLSMSMVASISAISVYPPPKARLFPHAVLAGDAALEQPALELEGHHLEEDFLRAPGRNTAVSRTLSKASLGSVFERSKREKLRSTVTPFPTKREMNWPGGNELTCDEVELR